MNIRLRNALYFFLNKNHEGCLLLINPILLIIVLGSFQDAPASDSLSDDVSFDDKQQPSLTAEGKVNI